MKIKDFRIPKKQITFTGKLLDYKEFLQYSTTFIETGTCVGDGVQRAIDAGFESIYSIEAQKSYFDIAKDRKYNHNKEFAVNILYGKSTVHLPAILDYTARTGSAVIYLDAHPAGEGSAGHEDVLLNGSNSEYSQDKIIEAELVVILEKFKSNVIIMDDINGLTSASEYFMTLILAANPTYKFFFYNENLSGERLYKDKILVAVPSQVLV